MQRKEILVICLLGLYCLLYSNKSLGSDVFFAVNRDAGKAALLYKSKFVLAVDIFPNLDRYSVEIIDTRMPDGKIGANNPLGLVGRLLYQKDAGYKGTVAPPGVPLYYQKMLEDALALLHRALGNILNVDPHLYGLVYSSAPLKLDDTCVSYLIVHYNENGIVKQSSSKYRHCAE